MKKYIIATLAAALLSPQSNFCDSPLNKPNNTFRQLDRPEYTEFNQENDKPGRKGPSVPMECYCLYAMNMALMICTEIR